MLWFLIINSLITTTTTTMHIKLITQKQYDFLLHVYESYPNLTYKNTGYDYLDKSKLSHRELSLFKYIEKLLSKHIVGFSKFEHFKTGKSGEICIRFQYKWSECFTGVGYLKISELLNGFDEEPKKIK